MNRKLRWQPSEFVISLLGSQGGLLVISSVPFGAWMGWCMYHMEFGELRSSIIGGVTVALLTGSIGYISFRLCMYFSKRQWEFNQDIVRITAQEMVDQLAHADYEGVVQRCANSRLTSTKLLTVIEEYGHKLVSPPPDAQDDLNLVRVVGIRTPTWSVQAPLWTEDEGRSDLTLELTISVLHGVPSVNLDELHVL